jgi:hypothetical protein
MRRRRSPARLAQTASRIHAQSDSSTNETQPQVASTRRPPKRSPWPKDTQVLATIHRSILWMMMMGSDAMDVDGEEDSKYSELKAQDTLLVGRLTLYLNQQGWFQVPIEAISSLHAFLVHSPNSQSLQPSISPTPPPVTTMAPETPTLAPILTMPQLVASLIITRGCRPASRPISVPRKSASSAASRAARPRSPLSSEL